jgi:dolichol-phosphate mannosyltransferase
MRRVVLLPTYNEAANIEALVAAIRARPMRPDILVVDDASPDGTGQIVQRLADGDSGVRLLRRPAKTGLGRAYVEAFRVALGEGYDRVFHMDADFSHNPADLDRIDAALGAADVVIGSRYVAGGGIRGWGWNRLILSRFASIYAPGILGVPIRDLTGGFKAFRREALAALPLEEISGIGYFFLIETTYRLWRDGWKIVEVPIIFEERRRGRSKLGPGIMLEAAVKVPLLRLRGGGGRRPR